MEEAFAKHIDNNPRWPMPYFAKASDVLIKKFEDCTVKGMTISAPGFYGPQGRVLRMPLAKPDMVEKFDKWESEDLNDAELAYYIDVQARVSKKLLDVAG